MRRVSEGFLFRESQLRDALTLLLDRVVLVGCKKNHPRSPGTFLRTTLENIDLKPACEPTTFASGIMENGRQFARILNYSTRVTAKTNHQNSAMSQSADYAGHGLLPWAAKEFIRDGEVVHIRPICSLGEATR
jgi:hypothetical protein